MKRILLFAILVLSSTALKAQSKIDRIEIHSKALINPGGENPNRKVSIYLPPGYEQGTKKYPVIYYLHGFFGTDMISSAMQTILDKGIQSGKIRPFILVQADNKNLMDGSFYTNSSLTGNWEDFMVKEVVGYVDAHYRTIANRDGRGIGGHSMGGYGAFKLGMLHPEIYSSIYALSPGLLAFVKEFGPNSTSYKELGNIKTLEELNKSYYPKVLTAVGRAWSPNPNVQPFQCDFPYTFENGQLKVNQAVLEKWEANMPVYMVGKYADNLRRIKAIKLDWGRNDAQRFPIQIGMLSQRLENLGINHFAEEYIGDHNNKIWSEDGRVLNDLLPFFNDYLSF